MDRFFSLTRPSFWLGLALLCPTADGWGSNISESMGVVDISLSAGSPNAPFYSIVSPGVRGTALYRGFTESISDNNLSFDRSPSRSNPARFVGPFSTGVLGSTQARAVGTLDSNGSLVEISLQYEGSGYLGNPQVFLSPPREANGSSDDYKSAYAEAEWNSSSGTITQITVIDPGKGYLRAPDILVEGGPHFLQIIDRESNYSGMFFEILSNTDDTLELSNPSNFDLSTFLPSGTLVEIFSGWTLGSLFGHTSTLLHSDSNVSAADWIYVIRPFESQEGNASDYLPHFHNGDEWVSVHSPQLSSSDHILRPDESVIIARRFDENLTLPLSGVASPNSTYWEIPSFGKRKLLSNPFGTDMMLSDLIGYESITDDNSSDSANLWLAHPNQDLADNLQVLHSSVWSTYWHDGTNLGITQPAYISARAGSGIGGKMTAGDFSMSSGSIEAITNPLDGNVVVTSTAHGLKNGFFVTLSSVVGRLTNENKQQINGTGTVVDTGQGLVVESTTNGKWKIGNVTTDTFTLIDCSNNCDFLDNGQAAWSTGNPGEGYDSDVSLSIIGGGGQGARATGKVEDGKIVSIALSHGGLLYINAPVVVVHAGGWKSISSGNVPLKNLSIPAGSGALMIRKHPHGQTTRLPLRALSDTVLPDINQAH